MMANLVFLLALASYVPTIDVHRSCRGAESAALAQERAGAHQRCVRDEQTARERLSEIWSRIPVDSRQLCADLSMGTSPSYVELLTCLEMRADGDGRARDTDADRRSSPPSTIAPSGQQSAAAKP
jgi:hypothetical protein